MKSHAAMHGVSTIAIPKIGSGVDQMNWQEVVKRLCDVFAYSDIHVVVYTLETVFTQCHQKAIPSSMQRMK